MAKQSFKNTIYQQITNSQVQKAVKEQRDQDFKMAQDLIAQYQPTNDDMTLAQNLIAQYQQPAPQPAPIKQSTVNEVKAESAPTQQIPSIEDFFKVKTASGKDINKESAKFIQRREKERELASKNSKEEIAKKIVENKEVKPFVPETNIEDQNSVNDYRKNLLGKTAVRKDQPEVLGTERNELDELAKVFKASMKDYNPKFTAAGKRWENPYDSLTDEQKQLVKDYIIQNQNNTNLSKEERETLKAFNRAYNSSDEEKDSRYNGRAAYLNSKNDFERGLQSLAAGFTDMNMPLAEAMAKGFSKLPILNQIDYEKSRDDTREYINESKALNPQAAEAGRSLGQVYDYAITSPFVGGIGEAAKLGKVGTAALNQAVQLGQDVALDLVPEARRMQQEEGGVNVGELLKRGATDAAQNAFMEAVPWLGAANYDSLVKSVGNNADIFKNIDATGALKNAPDAIRSIADAIDDSEKVPFENIKENSETLGKKLDDTPIEPSTPSVAEDIEIPKEPNGEIINQPVEPGKYEIPDTPENAPIGPGGGDDKYVSQFRTHNEQNFNMTDEELNSKYFNTQNENFQFLKGNRAEDLSNATKSLETDYEGTVQKLVNKPRDTQFTPQEVDEGFMAWNKELQAARETGDYNKAADIMYRMTQDAHDKGAGLQAYAAWKKNSPAGVVLDANEAARDMAVSKYGDKYIKNMDDLTKKIDDILKNGGSLESQANQIDTIIKNLKGKGFRNGVKGADELKIALANGQLNSIVDVHDILYNANKIPNLSAKAQTDVASIASEIYGKELTDAEKAKYINQINMILSQERNWSIKDKAIELSHILMLSGTRTHEKNIIANIGMLPQEALARKISALGQNAYALFDKDFKPTQAFHVSKGSKELAEKMFEAKGGAASIVEGIADKYTNRLADRIGATYMFGKMGKKNIAAKAGDKLLDTIPGLKKLDDTATELANKALKKIGSEGAYDAMDANVSVLENYRQAIYGSLSGLEDNPFVKENFVQRLASYIEAQNIKNLDDIPEEALDIARAEAVKATFKDDNAITELFSSIKKLPGIGELMLPFTKTPANLLARMIDFSPIGLAKELLGVVNKNSRFARDTVGETIDAISKGLGGSLTMALGMYLYANGMLTGKKDDDANIANYMTNEGWQQYSVSTKGIADFINKYLGTDLDLGDSYHDFSFMQPSTTNFITGIELWDELMDGKKISDKTVDDIFNRVKSIGGSYTDALLAQSTLQNVSELFGSQYSDDGVGGNLMQNAIEWPTRFVSGAISDTAKLSDDTRREYYSKNKPIDTMKNAVMSKLPILSKQLPAKYDVFGNEMTRNKSEAGKWFNTLGNPTTSSYRSDDPLYDYVDKLNAESKEGDYVPTKYGRYIKLNDETKLDLDNKQYSELTRVTGETRAKLLKEAQNSAVFNNLSPDEKVGILDSLENVAKYEGFNAITDKAKITDETQKIVDMYKEGGVNGIVNNTIAKGIVKDSGISSNSKVAEAITEAVNKGDMEEANRLAKIEENYNKACEIAGVEEKSSGTRKAWEDGGTTGLKEYVAKQKLFEQYDLENDSTSRAVYDNWGEDGLKDLQTFKDQGIKGSTVVGIYRSAKSDGNVPNIKDFATTYKKMDGYGDSNGTVSQKEFVAYLEKNGISSQEDAQRLATIYGDWSTIPVLGKKGWQFKKTK